MTQDELHVDAIIDDEFRVDEIVVVRKRPRPSRARTTRGEPLSLYGFLALFLEHRFSRLHGPGRSVYVGDKPVAVQWLASRPFRSVWDLAQDGRLFATRHLDENPPCNCRDCKNSKVKKPRGPRRQPDGSITLKDFTTYRGALDFDELQKLRPLVKLEEDSEA